MSYNLEPMDPMDKGKTSMPFNQGSGQPMPTSTQFPQVELLPRFNDIMPLNIRPQQMSPSDRHVSHGMFPVSSLISDGSYELAFRNKQSVQIRMPHNIQAPIAVCTGFQQLSSTDRSLVQKQSSVNISVLPVNIGAQAQLSGSKKRPVKRERQPKFPTPMPVNLGSQQLLSAERRTSQMEPPPKPRTELLESVRLKMRESLAAALATSFNQQSKSQLVIKNSPEGTDRRTLEEAEVGTEPVKLFPPTSTPVCESSLETLASNEHVMKGDEGHIVPSNAGPNETIGVNTEGRKHDMPEEKPMPVGFEDEGQLSSNTVTNDELLQVYGLCWADAENSEALMDQEPKRPKIVHQESNEVRELAPELTEGTKDKPLPAPESLATKIEAELFKLFGGVNKKYKEKGRSLLFNLKDRNNPELRERVLSGDIAPERLCSMTAEELASKELSEWRLAKAEELAQMVVLPDFDVDIRRLVRKTHKGEFQVEEERDDSVAVEVGVGSNSRTSFLMKAKEEVQTQSRPDEGQVISNSQENNKASEGLKVPETVNSNDQNVSSNSENLSEKAEFMQDFMVDELKDAKSLSPIVSLDEFMEALDSEPPFQNISIDTVHDIADAAEKNSDSLEPEMNAKSDCVGPKSDPALSCLASKLESVEDSLESELYSGDTVSSGPHGTSAGSNTRETAVSTTTVEVDVIKTRPASKLQSSSFHVEADTCLAHNTSKSETIWDGLIQLNISAVCTVAGFFRSGEKTSTNEWPKFLEIKGRVRLDAFEKFLQELPLSRSRAIMLAEFCWKEGSDKNGHLNLRETIDSYVVDGRVGYAEPTPGVELYLCPPHQRTIEMLGKHLAEDHMKMIRSTVNGLIGVVVWRRLHVTTTISPRLPSHHKHGTSSKKQSSTNRQQKNVINSNSTPNRSSYVPNPSRQPFVNPSEEEEEEPIGDIPPGFGPGCAKYNDDLPEFDFTHSRSKPAGMTLQLPPPPARPVSQMRELIHKYGQGGGGGYARKSWNNDDDDDDDIPEWQPEPQPQLQQLPPQPPQAFPQQIQNYPQQNMQQQQQQQPFLVPQYLGQIPLHLQMPQAHAQPQQMLMPVQQQQQPFLQQQQQNVWWPTQPDGGMGIAMPMNGFIPFYGTPAPFGVAQIGMGWRPDAPRGRGGP